MAISKIFFLVLVVVAFHNNKIIMKYVITIFLFFAIEFQLKSQASFTTGPGNYCVGASFTLSGNSGTLSNATFSWSSQPAGSAFGSPNSSVTSVVFSIAAQYTLMLTVASGTITSIAQQTVNVTSFPMLISNSSSVACVSSNNPITFKTLTLVATGASNYSWTSNSPLPINGSGSSMAIVTPTSAVCYTVNGSLQSGCTSSASVCINLQPQFSVQVTPSATVLCISAFGGPDLYADLSVVNPVPPVNSPFTYTWSPSFSLVTSRYIQIIRVVPSVTTEYTVEVKDSQGCVSLPAVATVSVENCLGLGISEQAMYEFLVHPNPVIDHVTITTQNTGKITTLRLVDGMGRLLASWGQPPTAIDLSNIPAGNYYLFIQNVETRQVVPLIKQ